MVLSTTIIVAASVAVAFETPAGAHVSDPTIVTLVDGFSPSLPGVQVQVAESVTPELLIADASTTDLTVLGDGGEPFVRIGAGGVFANLASPTWYLTNSPTGVATVPPGASAGASPRWVQVSAQPSWGWFEHRMHVGSGVLSQRVPSRPTVIKRWSIPVLYGAQPAVVRGRVLRRPLVGGYTARLRRITPTIPGLSVQVAPGSVPALFVAYQGPTPIVVIGTTGEPFLRIGPGGTDVNLHSRLWIDNLRSRDQDVSGLIADPAATPQWLRISEVTTISWLDPRGVVDRTPREGVSARVVRWSIPIEIGSTRSRIELTSGVQGG